MAKRALLVGLNRYPDPANALRGCLNDVDQLHRLLVDKAAFPESNITVLTNAAATTKAIVGRLRWLIDGAESGDVLVFHYSGHGSQVDDAEGDETDDGLDEIICPYDLDWNDPFTDDDLAGLVTNLSPGAALTVVLDCCHSGTGLRELAPETLDAPRFLVPPAGRAGRAGRTVRRFGARAAARGAVLLAACRADQVAADAAIDGEYHGAFTYYLCRSLEEAGCAGSYNDLLKRVRRSLSRNGFDQVPQFEGPASLLQRPVFAAPAEVAIG
jgi:metacaspase-1